MKILILTLALGSSVFAQTPTEVKGHSIGESADDFYTKAGRPNLVAECRSAGSDKKAAKKLKVDFKMCQAVLASESGSRVFTTDPKFARGDTAILDGGKLAAVRLEFSKDFSEILPQLTEKYGKPQTLTSETLQNGFGARFEVGRASWAMPDGAVISVVESIVHGDTVGDFRVTEVTFSSKEEVARAEAKKKNVPNAFN